MLKDSKEKLFEKQEKEKDNKESDLLKGPRGHLAVRRMNLRKDEI